MITVGFVSELTKGEFVSVLFVLSYSSTVMFLLVVCKFESLWEFGGCLDILDS